MLFSDVRQSSLPASTFGALGFSSDQVLSGRGLGRYSAKGPEKVDDQPLVVTTSLTPLIRDSQGTCPSFATRNKFPGRGPWARAVKHRRTEMMYRAGLLWASNSRRRTVASRR